MKDKCYAALFDKKDYPFLMNMAKKIRLSHDQILLDNFNIACQRKWDDHQTEFPFLGVVKADDIVVNNGVDQCIDLILGSNTTRWQYMGKGTGTTAATNADTALVTEVTPRGDMSLFGWREFAGASLKFGSIFGESHATITVRECGIFTASSAGIMLNRNVFTVNDALTHTVNNTVFVLSCVIEFVPIVGT